MLEILAQIDWTVHHGGIGCPGGGLVGKLSKCRWGATIVYVRENLLLDHFHISSNERLGLKRGLTVNHRQILELCAPPFLWDEVARAVAQQDNLHRKVRKNCRFTSAWAQGQFREESLWSASSA
jgi:hypothetical protein